ncbi:hypothetical protein C6W91_15615 [Phaeobacter sp. SYSU ZJ3003]
MWPRFVRVFCLIIRGTEMKMKVRLFSLPFLMAAAVQSTPANAQSVLERVLGQIDNATNLAPVNGTYANIAENLGGTGVVETMVPGEVEQSNILDQGETVLLGYVYIDGGTEVVITGSTGDGNDAQFANGEPVYGVAGVNGIDLSTVTITGGGNGIIISPNPSSSYAAETGNAIASVADGGDLNLSIPLGSSLFTLNGDTVASLSAIQQIGSTTLDPAVELVDGMVPSLVEVQGFYGIDGSINNTVTGITEATAVATASIATATEFTLPTVDFGDMATTALGAVNTGDITLGVNSAVDEAATTYTNAISAALTQIGGSVDTGAVVLNVASNMSAVDGSINNVMNQVNGSIGNLSTTALGAVNTGTIVSGVDAAVQGIVGMSGQTSF